MNSFMFQLIVMYSLILLGFVLKKRNILDPNINQAMSRLLLQVTLPALILYTMDAPFSSNQLSDLFWMLLLSAAAMGMAAAGAVWLSKVIQLPAGRRGIFECLLIFGNQGFLGFAACYALFGSYGSWLTTVFNILYLILIWSYAIYLITRNQASVPVKERLLNPGICASILGIILFLTPGTLPPLLSELFSSVGSMTIPLSMLLAGSLIGSLNMAALLRHLILPSLWVAATVKLIVLPLLLMPLALAAGGTERIWVAVLVTAMPAAPTTAIYAERYGSDSSYAAVGVFISSVVALLTLPLLYMVLSRLAP